MGRMPIIRTQVAEPYPLALGAKFGALVAQSLDWRKQVLANDTPVPFAIKSEGARSGKPWVSETEAELPAFADKAALVPSGLGARGGMNLIEHVKRAESAGR